jgi:response regulator NasT
MSNIVIAFPKKEVAQNIKKILAQSGYNVQAVCTTGAATLSSMNNLESGVLICGSRFVDMMYQEIYEYLPQGFQMLLIASREVVQERDVENLVSLSQPLKVHELLQTLEMMEGQMRRRKKRLRQQPKQRSGEDETTIRRAKAVLMERNGFSEEEAHRYIQKRSMDNGTGLVEMSEMILCLLQEA